MRQAFLLFTFVLLTILAHAQCSTKHIHHLHNTLYANSKQPKVETALKELGWKTNDKWMAPPSSWGVENVFMDVDEKGILFLLGFTVPAEGADMDGFIKYCQDTLGYQLKMNTSKYKELALPGYKLTIDIFPKEDGSFKWQFSRPERTFTTWGH